MGGFLSPGFGPLGSIWNAITDLILATVEVMLGKAVLALSKAVAALVAAVEAIVRTVNTINTVMLAFLFALMDIWSRIKAGFLWVLGLKDFFGSLFAKLRDLARVLFENGWKGVIPKILETIRRLRARLAALLQPLITYLKHVRAFWDFYFRVYIRPLLNLIQRVRQVLLIFRIFHLKFAERLDKRLSQLESDIAGLFLDSRKQINRLLSYINLVLDPTGLFQIDTYLRTVARSVGELVALAHAVQMRDLFASELGEIDQNTKATNIRNARSGLEVFIRTGAPPWENSGAPAPGSLLKQVVL